MKENEASSTAYTVMQGLLHNAQVPEYEGLVDTETVRLGTALLTNTSEGKRRLQQLENPLSRFILKAMQRLLLPGISLHYALRKKFIESQAIQSIADGVTQVVVLGAGFDTLVLRLATAHSHIQCIEIDHPATSHAKQTVFALTQPTIHNLHLLPIDLAENDLGQVLHDNPLFEPDRKTLFICEGVLMYIPPGAVTTLFRALRNFNPGAHFLFTATAPMNSPHNNSTWLLRLYLRLKGEPLNWYMEPSAMGDFLQGLEYQQLDLVDDAEMYRRYMGREAHETLHRGEFAVYCQARK